MKKLLIVFLTTLFFTNIFAQKMFEEQFSNCPLKFILEDTETLIYYEPNDSIMVLDFLNGLEDKQVSKIMGVVMMQIMVDTTNQICCVSYTNKTNINNKKFDIPGKMVNMPGWKRSANALPEENICALFSIVFDKKEITVMRTGYNRNTGRKIMESTTYNRFVEAPIQPQDTSLQKL